MMSGKKIKKKGLWGLFAALRWHSEYRLFKHHVHPFVVATTLTSVIWFAVILLVVWFMNTPPLDGYAVYP